ncbi:hypothetical protein EYZ11_012660 [Aspergillus tanneri]|uniref:Uncharacterized protein n=1 Tax=Aspergillus tanneri TaxID=1220188 RepID=A0A4V3UMM5_9EURO|nr:hypothetical protein EYZ11_012660 [Aspergillus tanneri]
MDQASQLDVSKLSDGDKKELSQFLTNEAQKSSIQQIYLCTSKYWVIIGFFLIKFTSYPHCLFSIGY